MGQLRGYNQAVSSERLIRSKEAMQENYEPRSTVKLDVFGPTVQVSLGHKGFARSGNKGANVNIGFFPQGYSIDE